MLEIEQYVFLHLSLIYFLFIETNGIIIHYSHVYIIILVVVFCLVTTGDTSGAGTAYLPEHLISPPVFSGVRVT
jgi:hypothetical protein